MVRDSINSILVHACVRMSAAGCASRSFIHDPLDTVSAAAALGAASERGIDLAHAGPSRLVCDDRPHLMVAEHIARANDHCRLLTNESDEDREGEDHDKPGAPSSHKPNEFLPGHMGVACAPRGRSRPGHGGHKRLRDQTVRHFSSLRSVAENRRRHRKGR